MIKRLLNQGWTVQAGDGGGLSALFGGPGEPPKPVNLPHDHLVEIPRNPQEPNGPVLFLLSAEWAFMARECIRACWITAPRFRALRCIL